MNYIKIKILVFYILFAYTNPMFSQKSTIEQTVEYNNGFDIVLGVTKLDFLNNKYLYHTKEKVLTWAPSMSFGIQYTKYPFMFRAFYFTTAYKVEGYYWDFDDGQEINFNGLDLGFDILLLPSFKYVQPSIGASYFDGTLGVGFLDSNNTANNENKSYTGINGLVFNFGLNINPWNSLGLYAGYKQSFSVDGNIKAFNGYLLSLKYKMFNSLKL